MSQTLKVGKRYVFDSAHTIVGHPKCGEIHGHTWTMDIEISATLNPSTGMVIDFNMLNEIVRPLIATMDHRMLNEVFPFINPLTAETLVQYIVAELGSRLQDKHFKTVPFILSCTLREGEGGWAEFKAAFGG